MAEPEKAMNVDNLEVGRELDALVAEHVMGWTRHPEKMHPTDNRTIGEVLYCPPNHPYNNSSANVVPDYSADIKAAMEALERVDVWRIEKSDLGQPPYRVFVAKHQGEHSSKMDKAEAEADTKELAICRALLKLVL